MRLRAIRGGLVTLLFALGACGGPSDSTPATPAPGSTPGPPAASVDPLREAASGAGKWVGAAVQSGYIASEPDYAAALGRHFSYVTALN